MSTAGPLGVIHGRFQPFHNEHLAYLRLAAARCEQLIVGITNAERDTRRVEQTAAMRHLPDANPYTYWERLLIVEAVLDAEGLHGRVVPFPISEPERLRQYVPSRGTHYLRVFDDWGEEKVRRLQGLGFDVVVLDPGAEKKLTASEVRLCMREGGPWQDLVPPAVARELRRLQDEADRRPSV